MKRESKFRILASTDFWDNYKNTEDYLNQNGEDLADLKDCTVEELTDEDVFNDFYIRHEFDIQETERELIAHDLKMRDGGSYLVTASIGKWYGKCKGGKIISTLEDVFKEVFNYGYDDISIGIDDGDLVLTGKHHDGRDSYTVYQLTPKGQRWLDNQGYYAMQDEETHDHLLDTHGYLRKMFYGKYALEKWAG